MINSSGSFRRYLKVNLNTETEKSDTGLPGWTATSSSHHIKSNDPKTKQGNIKTQNKG